MKMMLNKSIKMYIDHAEKIKKFLVAMNQYTPYQSRKNEMTNIDSSLSPSRMAKKEFGVNGMSACLNIELLIGAQILICALVL